MFEKMFDIMTLKDVLNLIGLILNIIGAYMMYRFSSKVNSQTILYTREEAEAIRKRDSYRNRLIRIGMLILSIGIITQLIAFFVKS